MYQRPEPEPASALATASETTQTIGAGRGGIWVRGPDKVASAPTQAAGQGEPE